MKIHTKETYEGLEIYQGAKSKLGFHPVLLKRIYCILEDALSRYSKPVACHIVIDSPIDNALQRFSEELRRWNVQRDHMVGRGSTSVGYIAVLETRPRSLQKHIHLAVVADLKTARDFAFLEERLQKLSLTKKAKIQYRRTTDLPISIDENTGEMRLNNVRTDFKRVGSRVYHDLTKEFYDCFKRISYIAKIFSKGAALEFSSSRALKRNETASKPVPFSLEFESNLKQQ